MRLGRGSIGLTVAIAVACSSTLALAVDIPVPGKKVTIVDKTGINGTAKITSLQKAPNVAKGAGGNPALLTGSVEIFYTTSSATGAFLSLPSPWAVNTASVAKFVNKNAPSGPTPVKVAIVKNGKIAKVVSKGLGGLSIASPPGPGGVTVVYTVQNGNDASIHRMCTRYSLGDVSFVQHKVIAGGLGYQLKLKNGVGVTCPTGSSTTTPSTSTSSSTVASTSTSTTTSTSTSVPAGTCSDGLQNQDETDIDCGGNICPQCPPGDSCIDGADCTSSVCQAMICQSPTCSDGVKNGAETDVDCGGGTCPDCALNQDCNAASDCLSGTCQGGICRCLAGASHTFSLNSNSGGSFDPAEWPGGTQVQVFSSECTVNIDNPTDNIDLVGNLGDDFAVLSQTGFSSCFGSGGEDGDGCDVSSCPPAGVGSCESNRPSCSAALNGSGTATFNVACNQ
jgi:hypothetical protein